MPKPPILKPRQVARILMKMGFIELRQRGSHRQFAHPDGRFTTLADHGEDIRPNMLHQISKDAGVSWMEFIKHL